MLPSSEIFEKSARSVKKIIIFYYFYFIIIIFLKHPKVPYLGAFTIIFREKHLNQTGCFPDPQFFPF